MYEIREYDNRDREELIKLWVDICIEEHGFKQWEEDIQILDENDYEKILVALYDGKVIGSIAYEKYDEEIAELRRVYVYAEHRGKGIAKKLYNNIMEYIKQNNYKKILVRTMEGFESGLRFYYRNNFKLDFKDGESVQLSLEIE